MSKVITPKDMVEIEEVALAEVRQNLLHTTMTRQMEDHIIHSIKGVVYDECIERELLIPSPLELQVKLYNDFDDMTRLTFAITWW